MKKQIGKVHEIMSVFYKKQPTYNPQMSERKFNTIGCFGKEKVSNTHENQTYKYSKDYDKTKIYPRSIIRFNRDTLKGSLHPTQKPVALCEYLIKIYTNENDLILDNCMGSGTTIVACLNTNRKYIGIEKNEEFFKIAEDRIKLVSNIN
jgi:site-specific DNA-methyltransferase (adenine-specific)